jgi:hypothetical protein
VTAGARLIVTVLVITAAWAGSLVGGPASAAAGGAGDALTGGAATGRGLFLTYSDRDFVIEGGTVAAPDIAAPTAQAAIDLTGLGSALAAMGYSPYSDAAGVLNAFGGTELPLNEFAGRSRAKVAGRPPQESAVSLAESIGQARARLAEGPTAEGWTSAAQSPVPGLAAALGQVKATVATVERTADSTVTVVLRQVRIGESLRIDSVTLTARAVADGAAGVADATAVVEGATLGGKAVRLTPKGLEPVDGSTPDLSALRSAGIEVVGAGETEAAPGAGQADARATGPRLRLSSSDGRVLTLVLGQAVASSTRVPGRG